MPREHDDCFRPMKCLGDGLLLGDLPLIPGQVLLVRRSSLDGSESLGCVVRSGDGGDGGAGGQGAGWSIVTDAGETLDPATVTARLCDAREG